MSVSNTVCSEDFAGATNGVPLPVNFPVMAIGDIYMAQLLVGGTSFINLTPDVDFTRTDLGGGNYEVTPLATYASAIVVRVFRMTAPTQPYAFSENGPLPAEEIGNMGDRLCMIEQETRLLQGTDGFAMTMPEGSTLFLPTVTFADSTARGNLAPVQLGQWGIQLDTGTAWRGTTLAAGGWTQFTGGGGTSYTAGNGLTLTVAAFSINTAITADLTTPQTLTDKTLDSSCILNQSQTRNCAELEQTLADGASIAWAPADGGHADVTLGGNRAMATPTGYQNGAVYTLSVIQDGTGSRTLSWAAIFHWPGNAAPTLSTGANKKDVFRFTVRGNIFYAEVVGQNYS